MKFLPICSSSKGNSSYIGTRENGVVVDAGCSFKALCEGISTVGASVEAVRAVLITHEHSDHVKGLLTLTKRTKIPVYATAPTLEYLIRHELVSSTAELRSVDDLAEIEFKGGISCFPTPHDAVSSVGYLFDFGSSKLGYCTDSGTVTKEMRENLTGCRTVFIEANYQPERLRNNPNYPAYLKQRIASEHGHLSNPDSAEFCGELVDSGTVSLVLGHLSQENNTPELAFGAVKGKLDSAGMEYERDYMLRVARVNNVSGEYVVV